MQCWVTNIFWKDRIGQMRIRNIWISIKMQLLELDLFRFTLFCKSKSAKLLFKSVKSRQNALHLCLIVPKNGNETETNEGMKVQNKNSMWTAASLCRLECPRSPAGCHTRTAFSVDPAYTGRQADFWSEKEQNNNIKIFKYSGDYSSI